MATIKQVSKLAQVSTATVSRVINNPIAVQESTRKKVQAAMQDLGYTYNSVAASLVAKKTQTVGYVVPELHGFFFGALMAGTEKVLRKANKHMLIATGHSDETLERQAIEDLHRRRCDALILHVEAVSDDFLIDLANQNIPFVVVNRYIEQISDRCIALDNVLGGYLATKLLLELGHREIAYIAGSLWKADGRDRLQGHKKALAEFGVKYSDHLTYEGNFQVQSGREAIERFASIGHPFSAVVCGNDEMAAGAMATLRKIGKEIPQDVSLVGFDNVDFAPYLYPTLTTVKYPTDMIGEMAAKWVLNSVYEQSFQDFEHILKPVLIARESCRAMDTVTS